MQKPNHPPAAPLIIAHRGASADAPENTLASFQKAIDISSHYIELDVRLSQDGIPVVFHDPTLARITGVKHAPAIHELPLSALKQVDAGIKFGPAFEGEKIPTLDEVLRLNWKNTGLMIEIKACPQSAEQVVQAVFNALNKAKKLPHSLVIGSFSIETFDMTQRLKNQLKTPFKMIGIVEKEELLQPFVDRGIGMLALWHKIITPELMKFLTKKNIEVWSFTVNDVKKAQNLMSMGVKGIISNIATNMLQKTLF